MQRSLNFPEKSATHIELEAAGAPQTVRKISKEIKKKSPFKNRIDNLTLTNNLPLILRILLSFVQTEVGPCYKFQTRRIRVLAHASRGIYLYRVYLWWYSKTNEATIVGRRWKE